MRAVSNIRDLDQHDALDRARRIGAALAGLCAAVRTLAGDLHPGDARDLYGAVLDAAGNAEAVHHKQCDETGSVAPIELQPVHEIERLWAAGRAPTKTETKEAA